MSTVGHMGVSYVIYKCYSQFAFLLQCLLLIFPPTGKDETTLTEGDCRKCLIGGVEVCFSGHSSSNT
jgi:hypothetical protein